jgi:uncharacterized protein (TIGR01244 family)
MDVARKVTDDFWIAGQLTPQDVRDAAGAGFRAIVNNRPDGEAPGQPTGSEIEAAAREAGLDYRAIPVHGRLGQEEIEAMRATLDAADGPVLGYCAVGFRSLVAWAYAEAAAGRRSRDELIMLGRGAGFDLSNAL